MILEPETASVILLVEDNEELAAGIRHNLELEGHEVVCAYDGEAGLRLARERAPDLVILDVMLPSMDGFQVLKTLRGESFAAPVLILTARGEEADKVRAFRLAADQYLTKPFGLLELLERVRSLLARQLRQDGGSTAPSDVFRFGDVEVNPRARTVTKLGRVVSLTPKAFDVLLALWANRNAAVSRRQLLRDVWHHQADVMTRTVDSHVSELRQKLEDDPSAPRFIQTVWKIGYRFTD